ncbi:hypothetical protein B5F07_08770 [Lachnoclostridium sp. An169]|uniref:hypothetical protein n=1 Tax=Lachnoclostridium sp. An169 TaxID=1965569 RepID=UPI000B3A7478|nr:hypothetical protein [Lachnoclostridium sp. An169]OUP84218.1 hypothetical protein B5F07_08770 [Lachnoclostridium sp. An169]
MKKYVEPKMNIVSVAMDENIASSSDPCSLGRYYSANKQECQNCKLYYHKYNTVPNGIDFSGASLNFSNAYGLGYADKESAINAAAGMSCPEGKD